MRVVSFLKYFIIAAIPLLIILLALNIAGFSDNFYKKKFIQYGVEENVPESSSLHANVMDFIKGNSDSLPDDFNAKEKDHLLDVKKLVSFGTILMYILMALFIVIIITAGMTLKANAYINKFVGKTFLFGGLLTLALAAIIFLFITLDFGSSFESFHQALFKPGTYSFDPAREVIVSLYPEQLFMDLGIRISMWVFFAAVIVVTIGLFFLLKSKKNK
jgi:integral membrane protein (TIGR01906 family)